MRAKTVWGLTCEKPLQFVFLRKAILWLPKAFQNLCNSFSCGRLSSTHTRPFQNLYKKISCGRLSSGYRRGFQILYNSFSCGRLSSGYRRGFQNRILFLGYLGHILVFLTRYRVTHTHTHTHSVRGGCWLLWGASSCCTWPTCSPFKALMVVLDKVWLFTGVLLWAVPATIPGSQGTNKQTSILPYRRWDMPCVASLWCGIQLDQRPTSTRERTVQFTRTSTHPS